MNYLKELKQAIQEAKDRDNQLIQQAIEVLERSDFLNKNERYYLRHKILEAIDYNNTTRPLNDFYNVIESAKKRSH